MKTKILILIACVLAIALSSCDPYDANNAAILIKTRVPRCVSVTGIKDSEGTFGQTYYVAIDSSYHVYSFRVSANGIVTNAK